MRNLRTPAARYPADPRVVFMLAAIGISGIAYLFGNPPPGTIEAQLDRGWIIAWAIALGLGGPVCLVGTFKLDPDGILLEQIGCALVFGATAIYAIAVWTQVGFLEALYPGLFQFTFGGASLWRAFQLWQHTRQAQHQADQEAGE